MLRKLMAVVAGYVVMAGLLMIAFTVTAATLGLDGVYKPGLYEPATSWILLSFVYGIVAAIAGGYVCRWIGRSRQLLHAFAGVVLLLGIVTAVAAYMTAEDPGPRLPGETLAEAVSKTSQPLWIALLNPLVGAAGVLVGGRLRQDPPRRDPSA
jgi:hypothetical protein